MKEREIGPDLSLLTMWEAVPVATAVPLSRPLERGADGGQAHSQEILEYPGTPATARLHGVPSLRQRSQLLLARRAHVLVSPSTEARGTG